MVAQTQGKEEEPHRWDGAVGRGGFITVIREIPPSARKFSEQRRLLPLPPQRIDQLIQLVQHVLHLRLVLAAVGALARGSTEL